MKSCCFRSCGFWPKGISLKTAPSRRCGVGVVAKSSQSDPILTDVFKRTLEKLEIEEGKDTESIPLQESTHPPKTSAPRSKIRSFRTLADHQLPRVALVGRPNVGKSALVNRLSKSSKAIVFDKPGITRDRLLVRAFWRRSEFMLIDTGGLPDTDVVFDVDKQKAKPPREKEDEIPWGVELQVAEAVKEADCVIFVVDGQEGLTDGDSDIFVWLKKKYSSTPVILAVNKCDNGSTADADAAVFWQLGLQPHPVSSISGLGTGDFLDEVIAALPSVHANHGEAEEKELTSVAIMGRPNTGKSSLLNLLVGKNRSIVSQVPGTTRDAVDCYARLHGKELIKVIDTAGIRRRTAVYGSKERVEPMMVNHSIRAISQCNIAILMIDCMEGITLQDTKIVELAEKEGCGLVIVANKFDTLNQDDWDKPTVLEIIKQQLREAQWAKVVVTSLIEEKPIKALSKAILEADINHSRRMTTSNINQIVQDAYYFRQPPATRSGKRGRIYYANQPSNRPPTFVLFVNDEKLFDQSYKRYIEKYLRDNIDLDGTAIKMIFRGKPEKELK